MSAKKPKAKGRQLPAWVSAVLIAAVIIVIGIIYWKSQGSSRTGAGTMTPKAIEARDKWFAEMEKRVADGTAPPQAVANMKRIKEAMAKEEMSKPTEKPAESATK